MGRFNIAELLALGHERRGVEFKGPGPLKAKTALLGKTVRAALGLANRRDGGAIVIGVEDSAGVLNPLGLTSHDASTWTSDNLSDQLALYADPPVEFELEIEENGGLAFALIDVKEFDDVPVICKRDWNDVLRAGACYVRSRRKPETIEIPSYADMRDLIDLATEKSTRKELVRLSALGVLNFAEPEPRAPAAAKRYREQLVGLE